MKDKTNVNVVLDAEIVEELRALIPVLEDEIGVPITFSDVIRFACRDYLKRKGGGK